MEYQKRILAFIDVLGFSNAIRKTIKNGNENEAETIKIYNFFEDAQELLSKSFNNNKTDDSRVVTHFSDSIVISYKVSEEGSGSRLLTDVIFLLFRCVT
ncbi:MAG: hypothetical protein FWC19_09580 [Treponema sp.]|nr:hypothetical protein [Treponema sp.]MCL2273035.1 hypothetical protein [Treponema sp.]